MSALWIKILAVGLVAMASFFLNEVRIENLPEESSVQMGEEGNIPIPFIPGSDVKTQQLLA